MILLSDVNLDEVFLGKDGKTLKLSFIDMHEGRAIGILKCLSIYSLNYQNCFDEDDSLVAYVGEVTCKKVDEERASKYLKDSGYSFSCDETFKRELFVVCVEGGEVMLKVVCGTVYFNDKELKPSLM